MIQIRINQGEIHIAKNTIKEVILWEDTNNAVIITEKNEYTVSHEEAKKVLNEIKYDNLHYLASSINNLTNLLRARLH